MRDDVRNEGGYLDAEEGLDIHGECDAGCEMSNGSSWMSRSGSYVNGRCFRNTGLDYQDRPMRDRGRAEASQKPG